MDVLLKSEAEAGECHILGKFELYHKTVSPKVCGGGERGAERKKERLRMGLLLSSSRSASISNP